MEMRLESKKWPPVSESSNIIGANATEKRTPGGWKEAAMGHQAGEWWKKQSKEQSILVSGLDLGHQSCVWALEARHWYSSKLV